jgi:hypothetical protein
MKKEVRQSCVSPRCLAETAILRALHQEGSLEEEMVFLIVTASYPTVPFARLDVAWSMANLVAVGKANWTYGRIRLVGDARQSTLSLRSKKPTAPHR